MKDKRTLHVRMQELCDCFATTDPVKEMLHLGNESDKEEAALKWLALAVLHGIDRGAKKISVARGKDGQVMVNAKYRKAELPSPGGEVGTKIFEVAKGITHLDEQEGKTSLAVGIRDSSLMLCVEVEDEDGCETVTIKFPD